MNSKWKILGTLVIASAFSTAAMAQSATPASSDSGTAMSSDNTKQMKKQQKKQKTKMKRERNQNGANGPAETSSKPQPAAGTGSQ